MSYSADPYRTLGLVPGASLEDVKRAYRRMAKRYHPDSAGEREVNRFLAIQAAYERIVGGQADPDRGRATPWEAGPTRARATRQAYRGRTGYAPGSGGTGERRGTTGGWAGGSWWTAGRPGGPSGSGTTGGAGGRSGQSGAAAGRRTGGRRKATLNSTSYDEATGQPRDPDWDGSTWYGASSGTYWTINPKEYADPRKHGPEYQARARRAAGTPGVDADRARADAGHAEARDPAAASWGGSPWTSDGPATRGASASDRPLRGTTAPPPWGVREPRTSLPAATVGLLAGLVTALPATLVLLASGLGGGDPVLAALLAPVVVGLVTWLAVTLLGRRSASTPP